MWIVDCGLQIADCRLQDEERSKQEERREEDHNKAVCICLYMPVYVCICLYTPVYTCIHLYTPVYLSPMPDVVDVYPPYPVFMHTYLGIESG